MFSITEYFGEQDNDTTKIFSVLQQFKVAVETSKELIYRRMRTSSNASLSNSKVAIMRGSKQDSW